jgi:hypothetical protein
MNIDPTLMPTTLDAAHLGLAVAALLFLLLLVFRKGSAGKSGPSGEPVKAVPLEPASPPQLKESSPDSALQLLALLQQDARFIDFIQEDLAGYSDADIGAGARVVHEGGQKALNEYFSLAPVMDEAEESRITVEDGFNAAEIRLIGNVVGEAPFTGTLVHRGWKTTGVKLPRLATGHDVSIIAAAEVEL